LLPSHETRPGLSGVPELRPFLPAGPVRALVKKNGADRKTCRTEQRRRNLPDHRRRRVRSLEHKERHGSRLAAFRLAGRYGHCACPSRCRPGHQWPAAHRARITQARADPASEIQGVVRECGIVAFVADTGDIWLYATPVLHASRSRGRPSAPSRAAGRLRQLPVSRRVGMAGHLIHDRAGTCLRQGCFLNINCVMRAHPAGAGPGCRLRPEPDAGSRPAGDDPFSNRVFVNSPVFVEVTGSGSLRRARLFDDQTCYRTGRSGWVWTSWTLWSAPVPFIPSFSDILG